MRKYFFITLFLSTVFADIYSQSSNTNSPLSRLGIGDVYNSQLTQSLSLGGAGVALTDPYQLNLMNPASYSYLTFPVFDVGLQANFSTIETGITSDKLNNAFFRNAALGFGFKGKGGLSFGLIPYSSVGFNIEQTSLDTTIGADVTNRATGSGGINNLYIGGAFKALDKDSSQISIGANLKYFFGRSTYENKTILPPDSGFVNTFRSRSYRISDVGFDFGINYKQKFKNVDFTIGATYAIGKNHNIKADELIASFTTDANGFETINDTVSYTEDVKGTMFLPQSYAIGLALDVKDKVIITADFYQQFWSDFKISGPTNTVSGDFVDYYRGSFGVQYTPEKDFRIKGASSFFRLTQYRFGASYLKSYLNVNNQPLNQWSVTFGLGMPMQKNQTRSRINLGVEYGQRGDINTNLIKESFWNLFIGLSLVPNWRDRWFVKRKYD